MSELLLIYLGGLVVSVFIFYNGGRRGRSRNPEYWATIFAFLWTVTMPWVLFLAIRQLRKK